MPSLNAITLARAGLAGLALVIISASLAEAIYGPRTTIGKKYQQWSSTQSVGGTDPGNCSSSICSLLFQPIPQQRPLIVQHVACFINVTTGGLDGAWLRTRKGGGIFPQRHTPLAPVATHGMWAINNPVMHLLKAGERPWLEFQNSEDAFWLVDCSISGTLQ